MTKANDGANKASSGRNQRGINFKDRARKVAPLMQVLANLKNESLVHDHKYRGAPDDEFVLALRT